MNFKKLAIPLALTLVYFGSVSSRLSPSLVTTAFANSKLGDLTKFKKIATDTETLVKKENLAAAKIRIKDLETSWDNAESALKPQSAEEWHTIDKGIDRALSALRVGPAEQKTCEKTIVELLALFDQAEAR